MFLSLQILRGNTHDFIFVDESCFIRPSAYREVVPMLMTEKAHMVLTSSHRSLAGTSRRYVDMRTLRRPEILVNNVAFVCPNHLVSMLSDDVALTNCLCYLFHIPHHVNADATYKRISDAFGHWTTSTTTARGVGRGPEGEGAGGRGAAEEEERRSAKSIMLSEIGILPPALKDFRIDEKRQLAAVQGGEKLCSDFVDVADYVLSGNDRLCFDRTVVVYIDPTPTDVGRSLHAMCFVTRAERKDRSAAAATAETPAAGTAAADEARFHYVLLAVEEFATKDVIEHEGEDRMTALARVFLTTIRVLTSLYGGFFRTFVVAPEANTIHVDDFWRKCARSYTLPEGVEVLSTTIPASNKQNKRLRQRRLQRQKQLRRKQAVDRENLLVLLPPDREQGCRRDRDRRYSPYELLSSLSPSEDEEKSYRIGYALGSDKVAKIYDFFSTMYNPAVGVTNSVVCATQMWSWTIGRCNGSVPLYIARRLEQLEIRPTRNRVTGCTSYKISGKRTDVTDDLAIAVVMSICLCVELSCGRYRGDLVRLDREATLNHYTVLRGGGGGGEGDGEEEADEDWDCDWD